MANESLIPTRTKFRKLKKACEGRFGNAYYYYSDSDMEDGVSYHLYAKVKRKLFGGTYLDIQLSVEDETQWNKCVLKGKINLNKHPIIKYSDVRFEVNKFLKDHHIENNIEV